MKRIIYILTVFISLTNSEAAVIKGKLVTETGEHLVNQQVYLSSGQVAQSNATGIFEFNEINKGNYSLNTEIGGQLISLKWVEVKGSEDIIDLGSIVMEKNIQLKEVEISDMHINRMVERMPDVKDNIIYAGKKNEVVRLSTGSSNLAQNISRQVFAKVPGVHVWESDGSGVQMGIATRGLSPNRMWEFNTRQNGYDIAADPYGYPESYYTPSVESLDRIEVIRGAASLQYGPQFGGVINYIKKRSISNKPFGVEMMQTVGNYGMFSSFNAIGGTVGKFSYYSNINYRRSDGWRENNAYTTWNGYINLGYRINNKMNISLEYTRMDQLVQQPGGLNDSMFKADPRQSLRARNWFDLAWNIPALNFEYQINTNNRLNVKAFGLIGDRSSIGNLDAINKPDTINRATGTYSSRRVDVDHYSNMGVEVRHLYGYTLFNRKHTLAGGLKYFAGETTRFRNTNGNRGTEFDLSVTSETRAVDMVYKTNNLAFFAENIFNITRKWSVTPGFRYEMLENTANGKYASAATAVLSNATSQRKFVLFGLGTQYAISSNTNIYANFSQAYRPVLFSDITPSATTDSIDMNLKDATGYNMDLGYRGTVGNYLSFDVSTYYLSYDNRIGSYSVTGRNYKTNIGASVSKGVESYIEFTPTAWMTKPVFGQVSIFSSVSINDSKYTDWINPDPTKDRTNKVVENAPKYIQRYGITYAYKKFTTTFQYSSVSKAYSDAMNSEKYDATGVNGVIPAYAVADWSFSIKLKSMYRINGGINNVFDAAYFTRRGGGYPGPGLLPADGRLMYVGVGLKF